MNSILKRNQYFIKEHVGMFKAANNYDILDPESQEIIMNCREEKLGFFTKMLRFTKYKRMTPFNVEIKTTTGEKILSVKRGVSIFVSSVEVLDENDKLVGKFKQKFFSIGGKFDVLTPEDKLICTLKGKLLGWDFKFTNGDQEYARVNKKFDGIAKELFTTADNYMLTIDEKVEAENPLRLIVVGAVMCIDMVLKE
ncbi:MAG: hypothetical protein ACJAZ2_000921 [Glaciecola sp.]|jgi:uncharacterized protein YxjI